MEEVLDRVPAEEGIDRGVGTGLQPVLPVQAVHDHGVMRPRPVAQGLQDRGGEIAGPHRRRETTYTLGVLA